MNTYLFAIFSVVFYLMFCNASEAQQCRNSTSNDGATFVSLNDGVVMDQANKLVWMRCSVGQSWDKRTNTCNGNPTPLTWYQASKTAENLARQLGAAWRLPTIQELSSITEMRCVDPAIDLHWFPNTPAVHYWTGTPFVNQEGYYWLLQFFTGENNTDSAKRTALVRLVKKTGK